MSKYTQQFQDAYRALGNPSLPIDTWYHVVGKHLSPFRNPTNVFMPVTLNVAMAKSSDTPAVRLNVNPADAQWYEHTVDALREMCALPISAPLSVCTYMGTCIRDMTHEQLRHTGQLHMVGADQQQVFHPQNVVVPPPKRMAADKISDIEAWHHDELRDGVVGVVAAQLKSLSMPEVNAAMVRDGPVQRAIADYIKGSVPNWNAFIATYARDDVARAANAAHNGDDAAMAIARGYLQQVRGAIRANEPHIKTFFAQQEAQAVVGDTVDDHPLFTQHVATGVSNYADAGVMWREIAEDAMYHGRTVRIPVAALYDGHQRVCAKMPEKRRRPAAAKSSVAHPLERMSVKSAITGAYPGDSDRALSMYHMFSGRPAIAQAIPQAAQLMRMGAALDEAGASWHKTEAREMPDLVPIACHSEGKKKKDKKNEKKRDGILKTKARVMPELVPVAGEAREMPDLVPIACHSEKKEKKKDKNNKKMGARVMPELVPIASFAPTPKMPELIPLSSIGMEASDSDSEEEAPVGARAMPPLVPVAGHVMPPLVEIGARARRTKKKGKKKGKKYVGDDVDPLSSYDLDTPLFTAGYDDAPNMDDFL